MTNHPLSPASSRMKKRMTAVIFLFERKKGRKKRGRSCNERINFFFRHTQHYIQSFHTHTFLLSLLPPPRTIFFKSQTPSTPLPSPLSSKKTKGCKKKRNQEKENSRIIKRGQSPSFLLGNNKHATDQKNRTSPLLLLLLCPTRRGVSSRDVSPRESFRPVLRLLPLLVFVCPSRRSSLSIAVSRRCPLRRPTYAFTYTFFVPSRRRLTNWCW
jgi:hypothetical protein